MDQDINILTSIIKENGVKASLKLFMIFIAGNP
jgi:hypothetical protein